MLNDEDFERLLAWLDTDREQAGEKYEHIHQALIKIFVWNGCIDAEAWADESIDRVVEKLPELVASYIGDPALYFYGVAKRACKECLRKQFIHDPLSPEHDLPAPVADPDEEEEKEKEEETRSPLRECTKECMARLKRAERMLLLRYYRWRGQKKIDSHWRLAKRLNIKSGALRVRAHRARAKLNECIFKCMEREGASETIWWEKT